MINIIEIERIVSKVQQEIFKNSNSFSIGMMKSHFRGAGLQFKEHQLYNPGDDTRFIDWKLSAKTNKTYIKTFEEERNVEIVAIIDFTYTMLYGHNKKSKLLATIEIVCLIYLLAEKTSDYVRFLLFFDKVYELPLKRGREGITFLVSLLLKQGLINSEGKSSYLDRSFKVLDLMSNESKLTSIQRFILKNKEVVLLGDYSEFADSDKLSALSYRRNMHCFQVLSPIDHGENRSFFLFGRNSKAKKTNLTPIFSHKNENIKLKGRVNTLYLDKGYLEGFVKEML
ncbi:DUF58 domain-containing protein [Bacteriovoracaceae bacterium]|nr:DUF58 domain-containing protein [Bacteriovoracaceae bacterium]